MSSVDSAFVIFPRHTTLVGASTFTSLPLDTSSFGGVQFQVLRGAFRVKSSTPAPVFTLYLEESLDTESWTPPPSGTVSHVLPASTPTFFSYSFRLRWFRVRIVLTGDEPIVTFWAEGLLRGGGGGLWTNPELQGPGFDIPGSRSIAGAAVKPVGMSERDWWVLQNEQRMRDLGHNPGPSQVGKTALDLLLGG